MSRYYSYINSTKEILNQYKGNEPFASFLKNFFSRYEKYGSKDRRNISHLCYCYFRLGKAGLYLPVEERILLGLFLCSNKPDEMLESFRPEWNEKISLPLQEKFSLINPFSPDEVFPWEKELSGGIEYKKFCASFFIQSDLFLRLRPGKEKIVRQKLEQAGIEFSVISATCIVLPNSSKIESVLELNKEVVVQDYSSQRAGEFIAAVRRGPSDRVWDCCAGSGGKSIMASDIRGETNLTVSDIRKSILVNLRKRFAQAGIKNYKCLVADLTQPVEEFKNHPFDLIIADVPCSGSGTWGRTPEQLYYFEERKIEEYAVLQKKIVTNILPNLKPGGQLLYITCSVFKRENEGQVEFIKEKFNLQQIKIELLRGYDNKADTMFAALLQKPV